jgi:hypothetical protein
MKLFDCRYNYETREEKGVGRIAVTAKDENDAILKVQMIAGADSRCTNCSATESPGGFLRLGQTIKADEAEIIRQEVAMREKQVSARYRFDVAARATVVASDQWAAYKKLAKLVREEIPPPGLKRKVVGKEMIDEKPSNFEANAIYSVSKIFAGGKAGG